MIITTENKLNPKLHSNYKLVATNPDFYKVINNNTNTLFGYYDAKYYNNNFANYLNDCIGKSDVIEVIDIQYF